MLNKMNAEPVIDRYLGSKRRKKYLEVAWDGQFYPAFVDPFLGAGWASLHRMNKGPLSPKTYFWAEQDASVRVIFNCWLDAAQHSLVEAKIRRYQQRFSVGPVDQVWAALSTTFNRLRKAESRSHKEIAELAAVSLVIRKLTQSGSTRTNLKGNLNVKPIDGQLKALPNWTFKFPSPPSGFGFSIKSDWSQAIADFRASVCPYGEIFIDPPYWAPGRLTGTYAGFNPNSKECFELAPRALDAALEEPRLISITVCNYTSKQMDEALEAVADKHSVRIKKIVLSDLGRCQNKHQTRKKNIEALWRINRPMPTT